jgi:FMN phosphatase YigB (HAD superfamily)
VTMPASTTATRALLIDFGGTLFLGLDGQRWLAAAARKAGIELAADQHGRLAALLDSRLPAIRLPGGDLSPAAHQQTLLPVLESLVTDTTLAAALYDVEQADEFWQPRSGARELLRCAAQQDMRVIVVSNIPWDIRPLFTAAGLSGHVHGFTLSFEVGAEKPDKRMFEHALSSAGCTPAQAVFVGNDAVDDAGALDVGIPVILVPPPLDRGDRELYKIADWLGRP